MDGETTLHPPSRHAFNTLKDAGKLAYGGKLLWADLEALFHCKRSEEWRFRSEYLAFSGLLKAEGFQATERGMNGTGLRILEREEMAEHVQQRELAKANDSLRNSLMLSKVPREGMAATDQRKLDHWELKSAFLGAQAKLILRKRKLLASDLAELPQSERANHA